MNRNLISALVVVSATIGGIPTVQAANPNFPSAAVKAINADGFRACKSLGDSGYTAVARGILGDGGGGDRGPGYRNFQIRTCFDTASQCEHFINRIHHKISQIELLRYIACSPRG